MTVPRVTVAILGAGGLARAVAGALASSGRAQVVVASRRPAGASALARATRGVRAARRIEDALERADVVLLAVPDRALAGVARALVPSRASWRGVVVLHGAGALGPEPLAPLAAAGAATGVVHPLAVLGAHGARQLSGAAARIEGSPKARAAARRLARWCGLVPLAGRGLASAAGRRAYHAAASLASNDVVALLFAAQEVLVRAGVPRARAARALARLAAGAIDQVRSGGLRAALTGPVVRGDAGTVEAQLAALAASDREALAAHRALSMRLADLAEATGRLDARAARALRTRLARGPGRSRTV